ncbi:MAG: hypothetical protein Q4C55_00205 [Eubacterium sp.]|nr:hypothetical protein [Eubacterium sp.]
MDNIKTLSELFDLYSKTHGNECHTEDTFPRHPKTKAYPDDPEAFKTSFCWDGVTSITGGVDQKNVEPKIKVLFILKESNNGGIATPYEDKVFWFNDKPKVPARIRYQEKLSLVLDILDVNTKANFGYMNLNKRGGFGSTTYRQLKQYVLNYKSFIKRQIELHDPEYIVFCGCYYMFASLIFKDEFRLQSVPVKWPHKPVEINLNGHTTKLLHVYHPAYSRFKESLKYLENNRSYINSWRGAFK